MGKETLTSLTGSYDNLHEPIPLSNKPETILGVSISFQVRKYCSLCRQVVITLHRLTRTTTKLSDDT